MAGDEGFEPPILGPEPSALPLGQSPLPGVIIRNKSLFYQLKEVVWRLLGGKLKNKLYYFLIMQSQTKTQIKKSWLTVSILTVLAGILYCSWPLGYILNPVVGRKGLGSELEALHQPYNWLFILLDVSSGLMVAAAAYIIWQTMRSKRSRWLLAVLINYAIFGIGTAVDALMPMKCVPSLNKCPGIGQDHMLILHGIASILAAFCLFISVMLVWYRHHNVRQSIIMSAMVAAWALFGLASVIFFFIPGPGNLSQHYFITLCSLWVIILPYTVGMPIRGPHPLLEQVQPT